MAGRKAKDEEDIYLCRCCGIPLMTSAEQKIGVHIRCVFEREQRSVTIPRVRYGKERRWLE